MVVMKKPCPSLEAVRFKGLLGRLRTATVCQALCEVLYNVICKPLCE